jgi:DNA-binding IclR family transcriptional regulator
MFCFISKLGYRIGVSCSAPGKAIIAFLPKNEREDIINSVKFIRYNERTITTKTGLRKDLAGIVKNGYSFDDSEQFEGIYCIGAPVFDRSGYPVSAVWVTGLMMNIKRKNIPDIGKIVRAHASRISARLGYVTKKDN